LSATPNELALLERYARDLPMLFIVSEVELRPAPSDVEVHAEARPKRGHVQQVHPSGTGGALRARLRKRVGKIWLCTSIPNFAD